MSITYNKNFLTSVIFRIDFSTITELTTQLPSDIKDGIIVDFPIFEPQSQVGVQFEQNKGAIVGTQSISKMSWSFLNSDKTRLVEIDANYLLLNFKTYIDYADFANNVKKVLELFFKKYPDLAINRVGMRYINEINIAGVDYFDWSEYINESLISSFDFFDEKDKIRRVMSTVALKEDEDISVNFSYGIFNQYFPNEISEKSFILDYDCYSRVGVSSDDKNLEIVNRADKYHKIIKKYFEQSITEIFRTKILKYDEATTELR